MKHQTIIIILVVAIIVVILYFVFRKPKYSDEALRMLLEQSKGTTAFPLRKGSSGAAVKAVQTYLNTTNSFYDCPKMSRENAKYKTVEGDKKVWPVKEDGIFGDQTLWALRLCYKTEEVTEAQYNNLITKLS